MTTFVVFWTMLAHFGPIPGRPPQQSQNKSLKPQNSGCFDRIGTRHVIKKYTHQDQIFAFFWSFFGLKNCHFCSCIVRIGPQAKKITYFKRQTFILNYYTSVKVGTYSIETICTGTYSIETLFLA